MDQKDTVVFGKAVRVGYGAICPAIKEGNEEICGSIHAEGPVVLENLRSLIMLVQL